MRDLQIQPPFCDDTQIPNPCGFPNLSVFYNVTFQIFAAFLINNLVVAVALKQFEDDDDVNEDALVSHSEIKSMATLWELFTTEYLMKVKMLPSYLNWLPAGLGRPKHIPMVRFLHLLQIPVKDDKVNYADVLYRLCEFHARRRLQNPSEAMAQIAEISSSNDDLVLAKQLLRRRIPVARSVLFENMHSDEERQKHMSAWLCSAYIVQKALRRNLRRARARLGPKKEGPALGSHWPSLIAKAVTPLPAAPAPASVPASAATGAGTPVLAVASPPPAAMHGGQVL